jgi:hypothetical protein
MQRKGSGSLLNGLYRTFSHCISTAAPDMASGSEALFSVLDADDEVAPVDNGGTPMHTGNGDHKSEEDYYGMSSLHLLFGHWQLLDATRIML